jgi:hypothetical protein
VIRTVEVTEIPLRFNKRSSKCLPAAARRRTHGELTAEGLREVLYTFNIVLSEAQLQDFVRRMDADGDGERAGGRCFRVSVSNVKNFRGGRHAAAAASVSGWVAVVRRGTVLLPRRKVRRGALPASLCGQASIWTKRPAQLTKRPAQLTGTISHEEFLAFFAPGQPSDKAVTSMIRGVDVAGAKKMIMDAVQVRCLNDAPCPPLTSHGASIVLVGCTRRG